MSEESEADRDLRAQARWRDGLLVAYVVGVISLFASGNMALVFFGVLNVPAVAALLGRRFVNTAFDDAPGWWRWLLYRRWHGKYRAFEDHRVRVIDGERDTPSQVFAADIFAILELKPSSHEMAKLQARYMPHLVRGTQKPAEGEWLFTDAACLKFVRAHMDDQRTARGRTAHMLALWLEHTVFMPIDNQRTKATGKTYPFTHEAARR